MNRLASPKTNIISQPQWKVVWAAKQRICDQLYSIAKKLPRRERGFAKLLAHWFERNSSEERALERPDILEVCSHLLRSAKHGKLSDLDISRAVQLGVFSADRIRANGRRVTQMLFYPLLLLTAVYGLAIAMSVWVMPEFDRMFEEFGIDLPLTTELVIRVSSFVRDKWLSLFGVPLIVILLIQLVGWLQRSSRPVGLGFLEQYFRKQRSAYADWAWHVSLLLKVGVDQEKAMQVASRFTHDVELRMEEVPEQDYFGGWRFRLLEWTLQQNNNELKVALLDQVAIYYRDQSQRVGEWWLQWLVTFIFWVVAGMAVLVVFSLFTPVLALISGLTGGFWGF